MPPMDPAELDHNNNEHSNKAASWWQQYPNWIHRHRDTLWLLDASASRLLSLLPVGQYPPRSSPNDPADEADTSSSSWRPIAWGLLELHRLLLDWAEEHHQDAAQHPNNSCCGTTSVQVTPPPAHAAHLRWALTALHTLAPVALELVMATQRQRSYPQQQQQARVRRTIERLRFVLRLTLLLSYWKRLQQQQQQQPSAVSVPPGLLLHGGRTYYDHHQSTYSATIPTLEQEQYRIQRNQYVGPRTGRRLQITNRYINSNNLSTTSTETIRWRTYLGELLYILRPLLQAEVEAFAVASSSRGAAWSSSQQQRLEKYSWLGGLVLDLLSLQCLRCTTTTASTSSTLNNNNPATVQEWHRRRLRLLLYLLRAPVGGRVTEPVMQRMAHVAQQRIPLVGGWVHNYLWDTWYYWKEYRLEEG